MPQAHQEQPNKMLPRKMPSGSNQLMCFEGAPLFIRATRKYVGRLDPDGIFMGQGACAVDQATLSLVVFDELVVCIPL